MSTGVNSILESGAVLVSYFPVVSLRGESPVEGWEAHCGGPVGSLVENPAALGRLARELGIEVSVDDATLSAALAGAAGLESLPALHLSVHGRSVAQPGFAKSLLQTLERRGVAPGQVVLRLLDPDPHTTELLSARAALRESGVRIALEVDKRIYATPHALVHLAPDLLELDFNLVRRAARHGLDDALLSSVARLSRSAKALMIARNLETAEELVMADRHGFSLGQGLLVGDAVVPAAAEGSALASA
jgi:EAL domain-containing protein (putative c-di-GMP-specific phosphodiesterase class I)